MGGRKPRGRGVLAELLGMPGEPVDRDDMGSNGDGPVDPVSAPEDAASPEPAPERESYEPGWYRISLARSEREPGPPA